MHDSKVGVVALYKISACSLCTFLAFLKNLPLDVVSYKFRYFVLHTYQIGSKYNKDDKSNYHQQY